VIIPIIILGLGGNAGAIGTSSMLFSLVTILTTIIWGRFSDETSKRKLYILMGFLGLALCFLFIAFTTSYIQVILIYSILTFFMAAELLITSLLILRGTERKDRDGKFGRFNLVCSWALTAGLVLGGISIMFFDP